MNVPAIAIGIERSPPALTVRRESQAFSTLRWRQARSALRRMLATARLRLSLVVILSVVFWISLFYLFYSGFGLLGGMFPREMPALFNAFFASLMVMLVFSAAVIMYSSLYCSPEASFLLTTPARPERIFAYQFQEAIWFSSWGFVLLGSPMLVASGAVLQAPWYYYAMLLPLMIAFLFVPAAVGAMACLVAVDRLGRIRWRAVRLSLVLLVVLVGWLGWTLFSGAKSDLMTPGWFQELSHRLRFTEIRLLPSWWLSAGLIEAIRQPLANSPGDRPWAQSILFLALLTSNALFFHQVAVWLASRIYRSSFSRMHTEQAVRRQGRSNWLDRLLLGSKNRPAGPVRLLIVKELRLFRRDAVQWSQCLIFFGLLALYFLNIRRFGYAPGYTSVIGFLNLAVVGLILSTFTTRFIYPMVSLEGRRLWILTLLPLRRETILYVKFGVSAASSLIPCCALMALSDLMLDVSPELLLLHQFSCAMLCLGLSGIAVGLGAKMPDLRETSPSKIAAGFGGTLNLVLSAVFIVVIVVATAVPYHFHALIEQNLAASFTEPWMIAAGHPLALAGGVAISFITGLVAIIWPLHVGIRAFRKLDI
jgi:ABC-2 type transport system permease protein